MNKFIKIVLIIILLLSLESISIGGVLLSTRAFFRADSGAWSWIEDPRAIYSSTYNKTYWGFVNNLGSVIISSFNHSSSTRSNFTLHSVLEYDSHDSPAILIRNDGRLIAFYSKHTENNAYYRISTNPGDISSWGAEQTIVLGPPFVTYSQVFQLSGEANRIYLFFRGLGTWAWSYVYSNNGGNTWSAVQPLFDIGANNQYLKSISNGVDKMYFAHSGHPDIEANTNIYAFYYFGGNFYKSDGTLIVGVPFGRADMTLVYDATAPGCSKTWIWDTAFVGGTHYIVFARIVTPLDHRYMYARWDGAAWIVNEITPAGGYWDGVLYPSASGGISIDKENPNVVYFSKEISGQWEIQKGVTSDGGASWTITSITSGSSKRNVVPAIPNNHHVSLPVLWMYGDYSDYNDFNTTIIY